MKRTIRKFMNSNVFMFMLMLVSVLMGVDATAMTADAVVGGKDGKSQGVVETDKISTTRFSRENSEDLLLNEIERKVVKIRPMGNPLEQLARYSTRRSSKSRIVQYYAVDVLPVKTTIKDAVVKGEEGEQRINLKTNNDNIFSAKETIIFPNVFGYDENGNQTESFFQAYILDKDKNGLDVIPCNGCTVGGKQNCFPDIAKDAVILRAGRAHNEVDIQTSRYAAVPTKLTQYLQTFRAQVEETTLNKIADKEADWTLSDVEEEAIFDMKRGMNKNFFIGAKSRITDDNNEDVYTTGGIYWQARKRFIYGNENADQITFHELIDLSKYVFTGSAGNKSKIWLVGSDLLANISKIDYASSRKDASTTFVKFGITFKEITTNFGTLWVVHDESLDEAEMSEKGLIIDPAFLRKYSIKELSAQDLDLRTSGDRDVDARNIVEISGLVLQNPEAHTRTEKYEKA